MSELQLASYMGNLTTVFCVIYVLCLLQSIYMVQLQVCSKVGIYSMGVVLRQSLTWPCRHSHESLISLSL